MSPGVGQWNRGVRLEELWNLVRKVVAVTSLMSKDNVSSPDRGAAGAEKVWKANRTNKGLNRENGGVEWWSEGRKVSRRKSLVLFV